MCNISSIHGNSWFFRLQNIVFVSDFLFLKDDRNIASETLRYLRSITAVFVLKHCADSGVNTALIKRK